VGLEPPREAEEKGLSAAAAGRPKTVFWIASDTENSRRLAVTP
jgi:hypothetical protein